MGKADKAGKRKRPRPQGLIERTVDTLEHKHDSKEEEEQDSQDEEERALAALVFPTGGGMATLETKQDMPAGIEGEEAEDPAAWTDDDDSDKDIVDISKRHRLRKLRKEEWEGALSAGNFEERLRERFQVSNVKVDWAKGGQEPVRDPDDSSDDEGDFLKSGEALLASGSGRLLPGAIDIVRCKDANQHDPSSAVVRCVEFHPQGELLLTGGYDKTLRFFQVDGTRNAKVHGVNLPDLPIHTAAFTCDGDEVVAAGARPFFYCYDLHSGKVQKVPRIFSAGRSEKSLKTFAASPDGKWLAFSGTGGYIMLVAARTKQWVADFKLNAFVKAVAFSPDNKCVMASGLDGEVYSFDIRSERCVSRFYNEGGTPPSSLGMASDGYYTAVGDEIGVVNVYKSDALRLSSAAHPTRVLQPAPVKSVMNLSTEVTCTKFNPDGQILAIASCTTRDALKLVHMPSCTVFTNWPTARTPVRYPFALDWSPTGAYLAVGNDRGRVLLYKVRHYS
ncbi:unnamed protein product [Chrysoparadoxa australica]